MNYGLLKLNETRVRRAYTGGAGIEKLHGRAPIDADRPEEWLASIVEADNTGMPYIENEGIATATIGNQRLLLNEIIAQAPEFYLGSAHYNELDIDTGVLVKFLDSSMRLALQAHPTRAYAKQFLNSRWGKLECYYILDIRENTTPYIYAGFQRPPEITKWKELVETQDIDGILQCFDKIPVAKGDFFLLPAGVVHAIGENITMIEIMEPSDWVVRCEFERIKGHGFPPEARFMGKTLDDVIDIFDFTPYTVDEMRAKACPVPVILENTETVLRKQMVSDQETDCFSVQIIDIRANYDLQKLSRLGVLLVISGEGRIYSNSGTNDESSDNICDQTYAYRSGDSFFAAAQTGHITIVPDTTTQMCLVMPKSYEHVK